MNVDNLFQAYEAHIAGVDREFRRVFQKFADRMQCRRGCSMCCSQMFSISLVEAAYVSRAKALTSVDDEQDDEGITPKPGARLPCPALKDDACSIYNARPIICRKWGIPVFNPKKPLEIQACHLNFQPGEEIDMDGLIEPQVALLEEWVELKRRARHELNHPKTTATVAEAMLEDYEQILEDHAAGK